MTRDGQTLRDYGAHQAPPTTWGLFGACPDCGARAGQPCRNLSFKRVTAPPTWRPHPGRATLGGHLADATQLLLNRQRILALWARAEDRCPTDRCTLADVTPDGDRIIHHVSPHRGCLLR